MAQEAEQEKVKFLFGFDSRRTIVDSKNTRIIGIRMGLQLKDPKHRVGIGFYNMQNDLKRINQQVDELNFTLDTLRIAYGYFALFYERVWLHKEKYEISSPFVLGFGSVDRKYIDQNNELNDLPKTGISVLEVSLASHYKFKPWVGLGAGFGYNLVLSNKPTLSRAFNGPFYVFKIKLFLGELYRGIRKKKD